MPEEDAWQTDPDAAIAEARRRVAMATGADGEAA